VEAAYVVQLTDIPKYMAQAELILTLWAAVIVTAEMLDVVAL
jgi:hypothetical protein